MLACWAIEETCYRVGEDHDEYKDNPESAEFADLWGEQKPIERADMHQEWDTNESLFIEKLNARLAM